MPLEIQRKIKSFRAADLLSLLEFDSYGISNS